MFYQVIWWLHRYLGLTLGLLVLLVMLTGSLSAFTPEIDEWLNPQLFTVEAQESGEGNLEQIARQAIRSYPEQPADFQPAFAIMRLPLAAEDSVELLMIDSFREPHGPWWQVYADPYTGEQIGSRRADDRFVATLIGLHVGFLMGEHSFGTTLVGIGGIVLLGFLITGIYLWWPGVRNIKNGFRIRTGKGPRKFWLDMHKVSGIIMLLPLLAVTITGIFFVFPAQSRVPLEQVLNIPDRPEGPSSTVIPGAEPIGVDRALDEAARVFPEARATTITIPDKSGSYTVRKHFPDDMQRNFAYGNAQVWVDQYSGEILKKHDARQQSVLTRFFNNWIFPIHTGEIFGLGGRIIAVLTGLLPVGLFITGVYCWWKTRPRRRQVA